jgi:lysophospholipase L1-like esterase/predicted RNase H-like HicB family nuclease
MKSVLFLVNCIFMLNAVLASDCWAERLGYKCCSQNTEVYYEDADGKWSVENNDWCGIIQKDNCWSERLGYKCCSQNTDVYYEDNDGKWGIENNDWCGIINTATPEPQPEPEPVQPVLEKNIYTGTWACSQYFNGDMPTINLQGNSLRQIIRTSIAGEDLRFHFSNYIGKQVMELNEVHVALSAGQGTGKIVASTDTKITFNGNTKVTIPAGGDVVSDTIKFNAPALTELTITIYFGKVPTEITGHAGARTNSFVEYGNAVSKETFSQQKKFTRWYVLSAIDVKTDINSKAVVCYGDSITDGRGSTDDKQNRWTDIFAEKLQSNPATQNIAVLNQGIGGSSVYGNWFDAKWPTGQGRFDRDVRDQTNVKYMIVLYGINDIIYGNKDANSIINAHKNIIQRAHAAGITVYGSTLLPFRQFGDYTDQRNRIREDVNKWILNTKSSQGGYDAVIDWATVMKDPSNALYLNRQLAEDGLHPNAAGYKTMGNAIDLDLFLN